jgi:sulfide dehydrogenase cytochrome subunit
VVRLLGLCAIVWLPASSTAAPNAANGSALAHGAVLASVCSGCHSSGGSSIVSLEGYTTERLKKLITAYRSGGDTVMHRMARGYTDAEIESIATYLGSP